MKVFKPLICLVLCFIVVCVASFGAYAQGTASLSITVISGDFSMSVDGEESEFMGSDYNNSFADIGTAYTVTAETYGNYDFLYWKNSNGKILSTDEEYSFILGADTNITAVYNATYSSRGYVTFLTDSNQELLRQLYSTSVSADKISVAKEISKMGYIFKGWSIDGINPIANDELQVAIKNALSNGNVTVTPIYEKDFSQQFEVSVTNGQGSGTYYLLALATVTADETFNSEPFRYWKNADGEIVSFNREYTFAVTGAETLTAVYSSEDTQEKIVNRISGAFSDSSSVTFVSDRSVKDDLKVVQSGIILANSRTVGTNANSFVVGGNGVIKGTSSSTENNGTYMVTKVDTTGTWYARPYVIYEENGTTATHYGEIVSVKVK